MQPTRAAALQLWYAALMDREAVALQRLRPPPIFFQNPNDQLVESCRLQIDRVAVLAKLARSIAIPGKQTRDQSLKD
jgi:hypothetical protein